MDRSILKQLNLLIPIAIPREEISFARSFIYGNETNYWIESFEIFLRIFHSLRQEIRNNGRFIVRRTINRGDEKNDGSDIS